MSNGTGVSSGALRAVDAQGRGLGVTFRRRRDRFEHQIALIDGEAVVPCLFSLEGDEQERWPLSPPLQQFSLAEPRPGQRVALLLGMAGRNHWSFSVETVNAPPRLVFDAACRLADEPVWLGSTYRAVEERGLVLIRDDGAAPAEWSRDADGKRLTIRPARTTTRFPATVRWRYVVERLQE